MLSQTYFRSFVRTNNAALLRGVRIVRDPVLLSDNIALVISEFSRKRRKDKRKTRKRKKEDPGVIGRGGRSVPEINGGDPAEDHDPPDPRSRPTHSRISYTTLPGVATVGLSFFLLPGVLIAPDRTDDEGDSPRPS